MPCRVHQPALDQQEILLQQQHCLFFVCLYNLLLSTALNILKSTFFMRQFEVYFDSLTCNCVLYTLFVSPNIGSLTYLTTTMHDIVFNFKTVIVSSKVSFLPFIFLKESLYILVKSRKLRNVIVARLVNQYQLCFVGV
jgi:hypothetical protein